MTWSYLVLSEVNVCFATTMRHPFSSLQSAGLMTRTVVAFGAAGHAAWSFLQGWGSAESPGQPRVHVERVFGRPVATFQTPQAFHCRRDAFEF
jgi:hypothetical protein